MANLAPRPFSSKQASVCEYAPIDAARHREALGLLLSGKPGGQGSTVEQFLSYSRSHELDLRTLWVARRGERLLASTLLVPTPGRSAMLFVSPASSWPEEAVVVRLVRELCAAQPAEQLRLIQALLDLDQVQTRRVLMAAGLKELATLIYMQREVRDAETGPLHCDIQHPVYYPWREAHRPHFARAIEASYENTLDCPALRGVRPIDDVIRGHQAAGVFRPELWVAVYDGDAPAGVMLLNEAPASKACELVYLGLSPAYRGRGLGRTLLRHALGQTQAQGQGKLILAVDEQNMPARRLYEAFGFEPTVRKCAMVEARPYTQG